MGVSIFIKSLSKYVIFSERKLEDKVFVFERLIETLYIHTHINFLI